MPENAALAAAYPFHGTVVDVGGGRGGLLAAVLREHREVRGILFDQASVLQDATTLLIAEQSDHCGVRAGDFFESVPADGDVYVLKRILHDWSDADAVRILRACGAALRGSAHILVIDAVIRPGNDPDANKMLDVGIMALTMGRERTADEFRRLFAAAGITPERIIPPTGASTMSIVVGTRRHPDTAIPGDGRPELSPDKNLCTAAVQHTPQRAGAVAPALPLQEARPNLMNPCAGNMVTCVILH